MKKLLLLLAFTLLTTSAYGAGDIFPGTYGSTFVKRYDEHQSSLDADYSVGSGTATFTASRGASNPATYVAAGGVVTTTTTSDVPRWTRGYYDSTGFVAAPGLLIEGASTNLAINSEALDTWQHISGVLTTADQAVSPSGALNAESVDGSAANSQLVKVVSGLTNGNTYTFSIWLRSVSGTGTIPLNVYDGASHNASDVTITTSWKRYSITATITGTTFYAFICDYRFGSPTLTNFYAWGGQVEESAFPTSYIPTTTAALTRNEEILEYVVSGNRTAATESMVGVIRPAFADSEISTATAYLLDTDTKQRIMLFTSTNDAYIYSNLSDSATSLIADIVNESWSRNQQIALGGSLKNSGSPYISGYFDGVADGTDETVDTFTSPAWGTNFQVGASNATAFNYFGIIQSVAFFSTFLDSDEQLNAYKILTNQNRRVISVGQ